MLVAIGALVSAISLAVMPSASGHSQLAQPNNYYQEDGIFGQICAIRGLDSIAELLTGWSAESRTDLYAGSPCRAHPYGCCYAGAVETWLQILKLDGTYCVDAIDYNANTANQSYADTYLGDRCGAPASGSKSTDSFHVVDVYGTNRGAAYSSGYHPAV